MICNCMEGDRGFRSFQVRSRCATAILAIGFAYQVTKSFQLDAGINIGVTDAADLINPVLGVSMRF